MLGCRVGLSVGAFRVFDSELFFPFTGLISKLKVVFSSNP